MLNNDRTLWYKHGIKEVTKMKTCKKCNIEKKFGDFYRQKMGMYGLTAECKECRNSRTKTYEQNNIDKKHAKDKRYREAHKAEFLERVRKWRELNPGYMKRYREQKKQCQAALHDQ